MKVKIVIELTDNFIEKIRKLTGANTKEEIKEILNSVFMECYDEEVKGMVSNMDVEVEE